MSWITLIITTAFSIPTMLYTLSAGYPFLIAFLQIVTLQESTQAGRFNDMFSLQSNDSQSVGSQRWENYKRHRSHAPSTAETWRPMTTLGAGSAIVTGKKDKVGFGEFCKDTSRSLPTRRKGKINTWKTYRSNHRYSSDTKDRMVDTASGLKEQVKDGRPMQDMQYIKEKSKVKENVRDLTSSTFKPKRTEPVDARNSRTKAKNYCEASKFWNDLYLKTAVSSSRKTDYKTRTISWWTDLKTV